MTVYEGARPRGLLFPPRPLQGSGRTAERKALPRRRVRSSVRAERRPGRVRWLLAAIVIGFALAFFSLAQTVRVSATTYEISSLTLAASQLETQRQDLLSNVSRLGSEPAIRKLALDNGIGQLQAPIVLPAR